MQEEQNILIGQMKEAKQNGYKLFIKCNKLIRIERSPEETTKKNNHRKKTTHKDKSNERVKLIKVIQSLKRRNSKQTKTKN